MEIDSDSVLRSNRTLWVFLLVTCLLSWPMWMASGVLPRGGQGAYDMAWLFAQVGVFGPALSALIVSSLFLEHLRRNNLITLPVLLLPLVIPGLLIADASPSKVVEFPLVQSVATVLVGFVILLFFLTSDRYVLNPTPESFGKRPSARWLLFSAVFLPTLFLIAWILANLRGGSLEIPAIDGSVLSSIWTVLLVFCHNLLLGGSLGEEIGWRGFLLPLLLTRTSPLAASLMLGAVWGLWHLPIDLYAGFGLEGTGAVLARIVYVIPLSVIFTWFYVHTNGSLIVALFLHTSLNMMGDLGLSRFQKTSMVFFVLIAVTAVVIAVSSPVFRKLR